MPSAETQRTIDALQIELDQVSSEVTVAQHKDSTLAGGLVKALVEVRVEVLKTTEALLQQRIHALKSGGRINIAIDGTKPDSALADALDFDIEKAEAELRVSQAEAAAYGGGLIAALKQATVATQEQSLALLRSQYLAAKYGLPTLAGVRPSVNSGGKSPRPITSESPKAPTKDPQQVVAVRLLRKRFVEQDYQDFVYFDLEFTGKGLEKPARAIKGTLDLQDLFGEVKLSVGWDINEQLMPGSSVTEKGVGFKFNQFLPEHQWVRGTGLSDMTAGFTVSSVLFVDGSREDYPR